MSVTLFKVSYPR